jgi:transcriptional regulator with XRE-family HTH domain
VIRADRPVPNNTLRTWRERARMSRAELADALSQTPSARRADLACDEKRISDWENGQARWPRLKYRLALRELTGRDPQSLGFIPPRRASTPTPQAPARAAANPGNGHGAGRHHAVSSPTAPEAAVTGTQTAAQPVLAHAHGHRGKAGSAAPASMRGDAGQGGGELSGPSSPPPHPPADAAPTATEQAVIADYADGLPISACAPRRLPWQAVDQQTLVAAYLTRPVTVPQCAAEFGISDAAARRILRRNNVTIRCGPRSRLLLPPAMAADPLPGHSGRPAANMVAQGGLGGQVPKPWPDTVRWGDLSLALRAEVHELFGEYKPPPRNEGMHRHRRGARRCVWPLAAGRETAVWLAQPCPWRASHTVPGRQHSP